MLGIFCIYSTVALSIIPDDDDDEHPVTVLLKLWSFPSSVRLCYA